MKRPKTHLPYYRRTDHEGPGYRSVAALVGAHKSGKHRTACGEQVVAGRLVDAAPECFACFLACVPRNPGAADEPEALKRGIEKRAKRMGAMDMRG